MAEPYYKSGSGTATKNLLEKLDKEKQLKRIAIDLRHATGDDRKELLEKREQLQQEIKQIEI